MNSKLSNPAQFLRHLTSESWQLENFIITFEANDEYSGIFHIHYLTTGRKFTGNYFSLAEYDKKPIEITLLALKSKFRVNHGGEVISSHFVKSEAITLFEKLNSILDIY